MVCLLWNYGIQLFLFLEARLRFQIEQGELLMLKEIKISTEDQRVE